MLSGASRIVGRVFVRRTISYGGGHVAKRAILNDFPIPQGSWQEAWNKRMAKGNLMLAFGATLFTGTCIYIWQTDPLNFEKVIGPYKFMKNPPAFESPVLEPNILLEHVDRVSYTGPVEEKKKKK